MLENKCVQKRKKMNLMQVAYEEIKTSICNNIIKPGNLLSENLIAKELNMSRTPVREALRVLEREDYIEIINGVGAYVKDMSVSDIKDIFEIRKSLEIVAIKTAIYNITDDEIAKLENKFIELKKNYEGDNSDELDGFTEIDWELHELIIHKCNNKCLKNIMNDINAKMKRYQYMSFMALNDAMESINQHLNLINLIRHKNIEKLELAWEKHLLWSFECFKKDTFK